ncbi:MAG: FkbM family methyltransferase [Candidatus Coatesbacteria bacterium]
MTAGPRRRALHSLIGVYALVRRTGFLDTRAGQALFASAYFTYKKYVEDPYAGLARTRPELFQGGNILDVGANIGYTATVFAKGVSEGCRVHAFEPEAFNFRLLERASRARAVRGRIVPVRAAVGDTDGTITLRLNPDHHGDHRVVPPGTGAPVVNPALESTVPVLRLDTYAHAQGIFERIAFIKIDVQGYETAVCRGMRGILAANPRAAVSLEYMPEAMVALGQSPESLLAEFPAPAWTTQLVGHDGRLLPGDRAALDAAVRRTGYVDLLLLRS